MEELLELREKLLHGDITGALAIVNDLEEMSKDDKINNIQSYAVVLLKHLIKQQAENRSTKSWKVSIRHAAKEIQKKNRRRKAGGYYLQPPELIEALEETYEDAIDSASLEVAEGRYEPDELKQMVDKTAILSQAIQLVMPD